MVLIICILHNLQDTTKKKKKPTSKGKELQTELLLHGLILNTR